MNEIFRQEQKYLISYVELKKYSSYFNKVLKQDIHNGADGYRIRSLYFDTVGNKDWNDKQDGIEVRKKMRLRLYNPNDDFALFEMKQKQGSNQLKRSLRLQKADAALVASGQFTPLLKYRDPFALECYSILSSEAYRPKTVVEYNRMAFVASENKTRVTFDTDIRATESCFDIFSHTLSLNPVLDSSLAVLEVKYNNFLLSYIQQTINSIHKSSISVSKYCLGRNFILNY